MDLKPLSQAIAETADAVERQAIAEGYADASRFVRPLMRDVPDGRIAVGAMDGFTALVRSPATLAVPNGAGSPDVAPTVACGASLGRG